MERAERTLIAFALTAALTGCGGSQAPSVIPVGASGSQITPAHDFSGEKFSGKSSLTCTRGQYQFYDVSFIMTGTAKGPYPGKVTARGYWHFNKVVHDAFAFHEAFALTSGSHHYHGWVYGRGRASLHQADCEQVVNRILSYATRHGWRGAVLVSIKKRQPFSESFY